MDLYKSNGAQGVHSLLSFAIMPPFIIFKRKSAYVRVKRGLYA